MNRKRPPPPLFDSKPQQKPKQHAHHPKPHAHSPTAKQFHVHKQLLSALGGGWANAPPFSGDEDRLYRWIAEPALWARIVMDGIEPRVQQRLVQLHAGLHDGIDASGFVCWRALPAARPAVSVRVASSARAHGKTVPTVHATLPRVAIRQHQMAPSSRFGAGWEARSHAGPHAGPGPEPAWLRRAWKLVQDASFTFLGAPMPLVDEAWASDRAGRHDATVHALCEVPEAPPPRLGGDRLSRFRGAGAGGAGGDARDDGDVVAAIIETPFPAERLLRSLVSAGKDDEVLYIDAIVADRYGAAYRLLCDLIAQRRAAHPERRLIVVLMAVVSSDVIRRYARWGFSYGGVVAGASGAEQAVLVDRIDRLHGEVARFEAALARPAAPSPCSVVDDGTH
jgi:hypothetical protein